MNESIPQIENIVNDFSFNVMYIETVARVFKIECSPGVLYQLLTKQ